MTRGWVRYQAGDFRLDTAWAVEPGSILVLYGPSGSGKSMTLRAIAGLVRPHEGHIEVGGRAVYDSAARVWAPPHQRRVGYLPQEYHLFPHLDVAGNIGYGLQGPAAAVRRRVAGLVQAFRLDGLEGRKVWELSGGQRQRVALARALAPDPVALLLDEPFAALDVELRRAIRRELLPVLKSAGVPIVLVTHDREEALALGDEVLVMEAGCPIAKGDPLRVLEHPKQAGVARLVGVENLLRLTVTRVDSHAGVTTCTANRTELEVPLADAQVGQAITVGVRADDVILASEEPRGLSARNRLPGRVQAVEPRGPAYEVLLDCGIPLRCHVTQGALDELRIAPGVPIWAVIKASSCFVVEEDSGGQPGRERR
ncbi:MAG: ABC transporter ATP-binding protein [Dehalococcoidia bacterium]|nr:ABC transporter ATP-binding protein [Dehalococcoidia bacterium]